jgi:hypothetical protein
MNNGKYIFEFPQVQSINSAFANVASNADDNSG